MHAFSSFALALLFSVAYAQATHPILTKDMLKDMASETAVAYGLDPVPFLATIAGESQWNPEARGDGGLAQGLCQIRVDMWEVSTLDADNPVFCLNWMAQKWREGHAGYWSYYRHHFGAF